MSVLATATLIRRFHERCPPGEIYDRAIRCYETLIDTIEKPETVGEISSLLSISAVTIKEDAETIINILLFNKENDLYLSFGLKDCAPLSEVTRRWKSLIFLYHPDKYSNQKIFEEKAKKINEIYAELRRIQKGKKFSDFSDVSELSLPDDNRLFQSRYCRFIPSVILTLAILIAIFSIAFLIFNFVDLHPRSS